MNVTCPQCASVFRVDPAKVPVEGVRARCSVCSGLIAVRRPPLATPVVQQVDVPVEAVVPPLPPPAPVAKVSPAPPPAEVVVAPAARQEPSAPVVSSAVPFSSLPVESPTAPIPQASPAAPTTPDSAPAGGRFANPFLQQDPAMRARRLARALVSDLVVYHPEKRQRGLADGTLKELFSEEIRKSWEEYSEQIGEELANSTPWFTEALNEILAEGRPLFG